jgi:hypothetical protein
VALASQGKPHDARRSSVLPFAAHFVAQEPQTIIRLPKEVDLIAGELDTSQTQLGDRLEPIERKPDAQVLIGEQLLDDRSNTRL